MTEVLLSTENIVVLGPPETLELLVDIGPTGQRGSQIFVGSGNPNSVPIGQTPELNDLYINISPGANYGYLYQYVSQPGGNTWIEVLKINPTIYSLNESVTFVGGSATVSIPTSSIVTGVSLSPQNFNIQYSVGHSNPVSSSIESISVGGTPENVSITFNAIEWTGSAWSNLASEVTMQLFITIVA